MPGELPLRLPGDPREVAAGAGMPARRKEEGRDQHVAGGETRRGEDLGKERSVAARAFRRLHRGGGDGSEVGAEAPPDGGGDLVADLHRRGRGPAVVDDDDRAAPEGVGRGGLPHPAGHDGGQGGSGPDPAGDRPVKGTQVRAKRLQIPPQQRSDGALGADEERDQHKFALTLREPRPDPGREGPGGVAPEGGGRDPVAVPP